MWWRRTASPSPSAVSYTHLYLGAACGETVYVKKLFVSRPDRALVRARAAQAARELALRLAQGKVPADTQALAKSARHDAAALTALDSTFPVSYTHLRRSGT